MFAGLDGCRRGWVAVRWSGEPHAALEVQRIDDAVAFFRALPDSATLGIDMPLCLIEQGTRDADAAARKQLSGQASSVFSAPARAVLEARDYADAVARSRELTGVGLSKQAFMLFDKVREVQPLSEEPRVHEVHPELSFRVLSGGRRLASKKTWQGLGERLALLRGAGLVLPETFEGANAVAIDDVLDAAVVAWSAHRIATGQAQHFPAASTQQSRGGRRVEIMA